MITVNVLCVCCRPPCINMYRSKSTENVPFNLFLLSAIRWVDLCSFTYILLICCMKIVFCMQQQNASHILAIAYGIMFFHLSICVSHPWALSKWCKLGSWNLHYRTSFFATKFLCPWLKGFPSNAGVKEGSNFVTTGSSNMKTVT